MPCPYPAQIWNQPWSNRRIEDCQHRADTGAKWQLELPNRQAGATFESLHDECIGHLVRANGFNAVGVTEVVRELVAPTRVDHASAEGQARALVLKAVGLSGGRAVFAVIERPANLLEHIDLHRVIAIGRREEKSSVVATGSTAALQARSRIGVGKNIADDATDFRGALLAEPLTLTPL